MKENMFSHCYLFQFKCLKYLKYFFIFYTVMITLVMTQDHSITPAFLLGKENALFYQEHLKKVNPQMTLKNKNVFLVKEASISFEEMYREALKDGIKLTLLSGFRSFAKQKQIWQFKYNKKYRQIKIEEERIEKIMNFSSMPGTSRHHWGTDIDVVSLNNSFFKKGYGKKVFSWLKKNGARFGFFSSLHTRTTIWLQ